MKRNPNATCKTCPYWLGLYDGSTNGGCITNGAVSMPTSGSRMKPMNLDAIKRQIDEALFALTAGLDQPSYREVMKWLRGQIDLNLMATEWLQAKIDASLMGMDSPSVDDETANKQYAARSASAAALDSAADESEDKP